MEMNSVMNVFQSADFGQVRVIEENGNYLFCGADVAGALGYAAPRNAVQRHCKGALKRCTLTNRGEQTLTFISEGDVYRLIVHSKLPTAEAFEKWVFDEVLPALRQDGYYVTEQLRKKLSESEANVQKLMKENGEIAQYALNLKPKAEFYDFFVSSDSYTSIRATAKELGIPEKKFITFLRVHHYLYRSQIGTLLPCAEPLHAGLFAVKDFCRNGHSGCYTLFTAKGKQYFSERKGRILNDEEIPETA